MTRPLAIDLFCGLGGWADGLLAEGWDVVGFDIERHVYGEHRYPAQLVVQDVLTLHGSQFAGADLIVASPPCQFFSYTAMPWSRAKALAAEVRADPARMEKELALFRACFRIQREACEVAGRHIPIVVENVRGAQRWVGWARWNYGSFYLWGDVPALMPATHNATKHDSGGWLANGTLISCNRMITTKVPGFRFDGAKFTIAPKGKVTAATRDLVASSYGPSRKMASAMIAKIPLPLARHIAATFRPVRAAA